MSEGLIEGFERRVLPGAGGVAGGGTGAGTEVDALVGGSGPPLLLLHGWPQTRMCWSAVAPALLDRFTVVVPDLRGYGRSAKPEPAAGYLTYSKRMMAEDQIATMRALGFERFAVAGHDRGARVAFRLAMDHPEAVTRVAALDVVPTADMWRAMRAEEAVKAWHWPFLAQPDGLPERLIGADPGWFLRYILDHQSGGGFRFPEQNLADYVFCAELPGTVRGWCEDYRAGWNVDPEHDEADRGRHLPMPLLVLWGESGSLRNKDAVSLWQNWAEKVEGEALPCGHFLPEEAPEAVAARLRTFFGMAS